MLNQQPEVDVLLRALADPTRRWLVEQLGEGPATVKQLADPLPMSLAGVMQHLGVLEKAGLVASHKEGRARVCQLDLARFDALDRWLAERRRSWERRLDRLGDQLARETKENT